LFGYSRSASGRQRPFQKGCFWPVAAIREGLLPATSGQSYPAASGQTLLYVAITAYTNQNYLKDDLDGLSAAMESLGTQSLPAESTFYAYATPEQHSAVTYNPK